MGCFQSMHEHVLKGVNRRKSSHWSMSNFGVVLSEDDIRTITEIWSLLRTQGTNYDFVVLMFEKTFEKCPSAKAVFDYAGKFEDAHESDWKSDRRFRAHMREVVNGLNQIVDSLDDPEALNTYMRHIREAHEKLKGVELHHFEVGVQSTEQIVDETLCNVMDKGTRDSWRKFMNLLLHGIKPTKIDTVQSEKPKVPSVQIYTRDKQYQKKTNNKDK